MTDIDSAAFEAGVAPCNFTAGRIDDIGESDVAQFSDALGRVYVTARAILLSARPPSGHTQPGLTVVVEDSANGSSWATVASFSFRASDQPPGQAVDSPRTYLRARWADVDGTWAIDVDVKSIAAPSSDGGLTNPIAAPLQIEVTTDPAIGLTLDASSADISEGADNLLIEAGDPDRLSSGKALHVTGKNGNDAAYIDGYGSLFLQDSTLSAPNGLQVYLFDDRPLAYGARSNPSGTGNMLAGFMSGGALLTAAHAAPADGDLGEGECAIWFDQTNGAAKLMAKAKQADGTVVTGSLALAP